MRPVTPSEEQRDNDPLVHAGGQLDGQLAKGVTKLKCLVATTGVNHDSTLNSFGYGSCRLLSGLNRRRLASHRWQHRCADF
jgi:hypothetical protein